MSTLHSVELPGLDGANPLAFLAALGVLRCLDLSAETVRPRLGWTGALRPVVSAGCPLAADSVANRIHHVVQEIAAAGAASPSNTIAMPAEDFRRFADPLAADPCQQQNRIRLLFASAYASDAVLDHKRGTVVPTALSFSNGQGGKLLLKDYRTLAARLTPLHVRAALFEPWRYDDRDAPTFRWDPLDMRTGAHMATDPGTTETRSVLGANALAFIGLSFLTVAPTNGALQTTAVRRIDGELCFVWPLWSCPASPDLIGSLLQQEDWPESLGVIARFASRRIMFKKNLYLGGSVAL